MREVEKIKAFVKLGEVIESLAKEKINELSENAYIKNNWFTKKSVSKAFDGIAFMLEKDKLKKWISTYRVYTEPPKVVGIVMAGNIPLVGFHDLLCVLLSGHFAAIKPSSNDAYLIKTMVDWIIEIEPRFKKNITFRDRLTNVDAVIATGSDNTARYFDYYFKGIPKIIRKNRTSVAVLSGKENKAELTCLGADIFSYFGLGCRNVSKIFSPEGYDLRQFFPMLEPFAEVANHPKYRNNYDYYKSIYLINKTPHLDTGFLLATTTDDLVSPISVLYHQSYASQKELQFVLELHKAKIQCIVGTDFTPFGKAQRPELWDYADNVDTMAFLHQL